MNPDCIPFSCVGFKVLGSERNNFLFAIYISAVYLSSAILF